MHVNNALFYAAASLEMLAREGVREVFFSLHSLARTIHEARRENAR
jgi:hypothetical protein